MRLFLTEDVWKNNKGIPFGTPVNYLVIGYHAGQDFFSKPIGQIPVLAPCNGFLTTFPFSRSAGWWGYFKFEYNGQIYSLKILHMYKEMKGGEYKVGEVLGYCGATGLSVTSKYGEAYIGESDEEQTSDKAVPHLHVELHIGEFKHDTNTNKILAAKRIIDPVVYFEKWVNQSLLTKSNDMVFYKEPGKSSVYIKGADNVYYPILMEKHFIALFGDWSKNTVKEIDNLTPKSDCYFGLFKSNDAGTYNAE